MLAPQQAAARREPRMPSGRVTVLRSPALAVGDDYTVDSAALTLGRSAQNDIALEADEFASALHARLDPRRDGVWIEDVGSTNGTFVNGSRLQRPRRLNPGDVVRVGQTDMRLEA